MNTVGITIIETYLHLEKSAYKVTLSLPYIVQMYKHTVEFHNIN